MKKTIHIVFVLTILLFQNTASAQQSLTLYNMEVVPQRMYANPALKPTYSKYNVGLPGISSQYLNLSHSGFKYSDLVKHEADDSLHLDFGNMLSKLSKNNYMTVAYHPDLLSFGFIIKEKNYFSVNITEKIDLRFRYPKKFLEFVWKGNGDPDLLGQDVNFNFGLNFSHYREYGLGYARDLNDKITIGVKVKYLYGMENIWTEKSDVTLNTDPNYFAITAKSNIIINTSGVDTNSFDNLSVSKYAFKKKNHGMGIDIGGVYKYNDKFSFSGSMIDLGFIKWKDATTNYQSHDADGSFTYQGVDLNQFVNNDSLNLEQAFEIMGDSLSKIFKIDTVHESYTTKLSTQIYLGANYYINEKSNAGILFYGQVFDKVLHPGVALSFNQRVGRWLNVSASYSIYNRSYNNIGLGLALNAGPVQFYMVSDNVLGAIFPQNTKNLHVQFGINLTMGRKQKDRDKDGIADKKDDCPDVPGIEEFKGCPDKDGDHIQDKDDLCPDIAGLPAFHGCPDKDGDGIIDGEDECPDTAGLAQFKGCPDKDGDGVPDKLDECPDVPGLQDFKGCPDRDSDGTQDKLDLCPDKPGPASNDGCPEIKLNLIDTDGKILRSAIKGKDGFFRFDDLPADEFVLFKLEGEDTDSLKEIKVMVGGVPKMAFIDEKTRFFKFVILKTDDNKLKRENENDVAVKLTKAEEEIIKKAFNNLEFASAKDIIKQESFASLDELAALMAKKPLWHLKISGHTDNQGNAVTNMKLSQKRAEAIKKYLVNKGIAENRFKVEWFGATKPIADNKTEAGRQKNRRVEMLIIE
ncbi:MAG: hypothetical protein A3F72_11070 [Bacteroidetes bacterium RIFCSPLOWO2_12_FULL_35_15]|nr:MAG: hypothetical protein A3F72_11070 [Bacteroidetes bacterium RIFCSPLOWO2_12_FULL_35_15]